MMRCSRVQALLDAYVDGELNRLTGWFVARHLRGCSRCFQEFQTARVQREEAQAWLNAAAPTHMRARIEAALANPIQAAPALAASPNKDTLYEPGIPEHVIRQPRFKRFTLLVTGTATLSILLLWLVVLPGLAQLRSLSRVHKTMQEAQTVHWTVQARIPCTISPANPQADSGASAEQTLTMNFWARPHPAAIAYQDVEGEYYLVSSDHPLPANEPQIYVTVAPGQEPGSTPSMAMPTTPVGTMPYSNSAMTTPFQPGLMDLSLLFSPEMLQEAQVPGENSLREDYKSWKYEQTTLNGRRVNRFSRQTETRPPIPPQQGGTYVLRSRQTVVADATTHYIVSAEEVLTLLVSGQPEITLATIEMVNFEYNISPPPGIFDPHSELYRRKP